MREHDLPSTTFEKDCFQAINEKRELHIETPALKWNNELAKEAQKDAEALQNGKSLTDGQITFGSKCQDEKGSDVIVTWYSKSANYDYAAGAGIDGSFEYSFTQLVWNSSKNVGVGISSKQLPNGNYSTKVVARFNPRGNWTGGFVEHVKNLKDLSSAEPDKFNGGGVTKSDTNGGKSLKDISLEEMNGKRFLHQNTPNLKWNDELAKHAQKAVSSMINGGNEPHLDGEGFNAFFSSEPTEVGIPEIVEAWYSEIKYYDFNTGKSTDPNQTVYHFTRLVWDTVTEVGFANKWNGKD